MVKIITLEIIHAFIKEQVEIRRFFLHFQEEWISSVIAALLIEAIGQRLVCVHVNHGLLRKDEPEKDIKAHHKAGGLPEGMNFELVELV